MPIRILKENTMIYQCEKCGGYSSPTEPGSTALPLSWVIYCNQFTYCPDCAPSFWSEHERERNVLREANAAAVSGEQLARAESNVFRQQNKDLAMENTSLRESLAKVLCERDALKTERLSYDCQHSADMDHIAQLVKDLQTARANYACLEDINKNRELAYELIRRYRAALDAIMNSPYANLQIRTIAKESLDTTNL